MLLQTGKQITTIYIIPHTSRSKDNQTMKFGQLIEYNMRNCFFFKNYAENEPGRIVPGLVLSFKIALYDVTATGHHPSFNIFW